MQLYLRGSIWWATIDVGGKRIRLSTKQRERLAAMEAAREMVAPLLVGKRADRILDVASRMAEGLRRDARERAAASLPFSAAFENYPRTRRDGLPKAPSTLKNEVVLWRAFSRKMEEWGYRHLAEVPASSARRYLEGLPGRARQVAYQVLKNVYLSNGISHPFGEKPRRMAGEVQHREALSPDQIRGLLETVERMTGGPGQASAEYRLFLRFLLYTGLRLGDAATCRVSQVDFSEGTLERLMAKTGRRVCIPLHPSILALIPREGEYLFPRLAEIYQHGQGSISHRIRAFFKAAGIAGPRQAYCPHCLRTTFAEMCAERNVPISVIQSWLGHTSQEVTRIYARVESLRAKREAMAKLPDF